MKERMKQRIFETRIVFHSSSMSMVKDKFDTLDEAIQDAKLRELYNEEKDSQSYFVKEIIIINHYLNHYL